MFSNGLGHGSVGREIVGYLRDHSARLINCELTGSAGAGAGVLESPTLEVGACFRLWFSQFPNFHVALSTVAPIPIRRQDGVWMGIGAVGIVGMGGLAG